MTKSLKLVLVLVQSNLRHEMEPGRVFPGPRTACHLSPTHGVLSALTRPPTITIPRASSRVGSREAKGCIVPDENFRTGHRARRIHGEGERKTKLRKRDRKSTMHQELPVHPGLKSAYGSLMGSSDVAAL